MSKRPTQGSTFRVFGEVVSSSPKRCNSSPSVAPSSPQSDENQRELFQAKLQAQLQKNLVRLQNEKNSKPLSPLNARPRASLKPVSPLIINEASLLAERDANCDSPCPMKCTGKRPLSPDFCIDDLSPLPKIRKSLLVLPSSPSAFLHIAPEQQEEEKIVVAEKEFFDAKRLAATREILTTERTYNEQLKRLYELFALTIKNSALLNPYQWETIFGALEPVIFQSNQLLNLLEDRLGHTDALVASPPSHGDEIASLSVADIFTSTLPHSLDDYAHYCQKYSAAHQLASHIYQTNIGFQSFMNRLSKVSSPSEALSINSPRPDQPGRLVRRQTEPVRAPVNMAQNAKQEQLGLFDLMILPIQRIPRYELLLGALLKQTPSVHSQYGPLIEARAAVIKMNQHVDSKLKESENRRRIIELRNTIAVVSQSSSFHTCSTSSSASEAFSPTSPPRQQIKLHNNFSPSILSSPVKSPGPVASLGSPMAAIQQDWVHRVVKNPSIIPHIKTADGRAMTINRLDRILGFDRLFVRSGLMEGFVHYRAMSQPSPSFFSPSKTAQTAPNEEFFAPEDLERLENKAFSNNMKPGLSTFSEAIRYKQQYWLLLLHNLLVIGRPLPKQMAHSINTFSFTSSSSSSSSSSSEKNGLKSARNTIDFPSPPATSHQRPGFSRHSAVSSTLTDLKEIMNVDYVIPLETVNIKDLTPEEVPGLMEHIEQQAIASPSSKKKQVVTPFQIIAPEVSMTFVSSTRVEKLHWMKTIQSSLDHLLFTQEPGRQLRRARLAVQCDEEEDEKMICKFWYCVPDNLKFCTSRTESYQSTDITAKELEKLMSNPKFIERQEELRKSSSSSSSSSSLSPKFSRSATSSPSGETGKSGGFVSSSAERVRSLLRQTVSKLSPLKILTPTRVVSVRKSSSKKEKNGSSSTSSSAKKIRDHLKNLRSSSSSNLRSPILSEQNDASPSEQRRATPLKEGAGETSGSKWKRFSTRFQTWNEKTLSALQKNLQSAIDLDILGEDLKKPSEQQGESEGSVVLQSVMEKDEYPVSSTSPSHRLCFRKTKKSAGRQGSDLHLKHSGSSSFAPIRVDESLEKVSTSYQHASLQDVSASRRPLARPSQMTTSASETVDQYPFVRSATRRRRPVRTTMYNSPTRKSNLRDRVAVSPGSPSIKSIPSSSSSSVSVSVSSPLVSSPHSSCLASPTGSPGHTPPPLSERTSIVRGRSRGWNHDDDDLI